VAECQGQSLPVHRPETTWTCVPTLELDSERGRARPGLVGDRRDQDPLDNARFDTPYQVAPPRPTSDSVCRPRLRARPHERRTGPLTLIVAPAQDGKVTLAACCLKGYPEKSAGEPLDDRSADLRILLPYVVVAVAAACATACAQAHPHPHTEMPAGSGLLSMLYRVHLAIGDIKATESETSAVEVT